MNPRPTTPADTKLDQGKEDGVAMSITRWPCRRSQSLLILRSPRFTAVLGQESLQLSHTVQHLCFLLGLGSLEAVNAGLQLLAHLLLLLNLGNLRLKRRKALVTSGWVRRRLSTKRTRKRFSTSGLGPFSHMMLQPGNGLCSQLRGTIYAPLKPEAWRSRGRSVCSTLA